MLPILDESGDVVADMAAIATILQTLMTVVRQGNRIMTEVTDEKRGNQKIFSLSGGTVPAFLFFAGTQPRSAQRKNANSNGEESLVTKTDPT